MVSYVVGFFCGIIIAFCGMGIAAHVYSKRKNKMFAHMIKYLVYLTADEQNMFLNKIGKKTKKPDLRIVKNDADENG